MPVWLQVACADGLCACRFHIMGGECNYLLRVSRDSAKRLEFVPDEQWKSRAMMAWSEEAIQGMLSSAESILRETAHRLRLPVTVRSCFWSLPKTSAQLHIASVVIGLFNTCTLPMFMEEAS